MGMPGPWYERLPHFRLEFTPSSGKELQSEIWCPDRKPVDALRAMNHLNRQIAPAANLEVTPIAADDLSISPCYMQDCIGIHFTWRRDWEDYARSSPLIEEALASPRQRTRTAGRAHDARRAGSPHSTPCCPIFSASCATTTHKGSSATTSRHVYLRVAGCR